jgi:hypothetical protein
MKTILVPLDHTAAAEATLAYANKLAVRWPAEVVILCCHPDATATQAALQDEAQRLRSLVEPCATSSSPATMAAAFATATGCWPAACTSMCKPKPSSAPPTC